MYLKQISIINFKNIGRCTLDFPSRITCFVGDNGAGKTNIMDAIYYMSMCKSSLGMTDGQSLRHGEDFFLLDGRYESDRGLQDNVVCGFKRGAGKTVKRGGKEYERLSEHIGAIPIVIVSPTDSALISDAAEERRRYLNAFLSQTDRDYLNAIVRYNHILGERNRLLKSDAPGTDELLDIMDMQMCDTGGIVHAKRKMLVDELAPLVAEYYAALSDDHERIELSYRSELNERPLADILRDSRAKDRINGFSTAGPHRDDMTMRIGGHPLRKYGSQGQQKSFLIALKLGQYRIAAERGGEKPLLLLDDIFDKLDNGRVSRLLSLVGDGFGQIFISDCSRERLETILGESTGGYSLWNVKDGEVTQ